jgi:hypothetical protein
MGVEPPWMLVGGSSQAALGPAEAVREPSEKIGLRSQANGAKYDAREEP